MEQSLIEELVKELETRVDRLRALYEQYFMGIEKLEPHVPRKDVERRFQTLRKEQIRNTALRFRFQMVLQRYNTYQSYWIRICRQIEEGTYKRDVLRAKAREARAATVEEVEEVELEDGGYDLTGELSLLDANDIAELEHLLGPSLRAPSKPPPPPARPRRSSSVRPPPPPPRASRPPLPPRASRPPPVSIPAAAPLPRMASVAPPQPAAPRPPGLSVSSGTLPAAPPGAPPKPSHSRMKMLAQRLKEREAAQRLAEAEATGAAPPRLPEPPTPAPRVAAPAPVSPAAAARRPPPPPILPRSGGGIPGPPPLSSITAAGAPPAGAPPRLASAQQAQQLQRLPADLPDARLRALYSKYVDTRREHNEPTDALTLEGMARTLRESQQKLREKHVGKSVDFEVVVKDGRTVLRPVVK